MKNKTLIFTLAAILFASFALAPTANAFAPIAVAVAFPLAAAFSLFGMVMKQFVTPHNDYAAATSAPGPTGALAKEVESKETTN
jgi:hypothetical protein